MKTTVPMARQFMWDNLSYTKNEFEKANAFILQGRCEWYSLMDVMANLVCVNVTPATLDRAIAKINLEVPSQFLNEWLTKLHEIKVNVRFITSDGLTSNLRSFELVQ